MFIEVGKTNGLFSVDNPPVQPKIFVISPAQELYHAVLRFLVVPDEADRRKKTRQKNTLRKMNGDQAAVIEGSTLQEGYKYSSKELCPY